MLVRNTTIVGGAGHQGSRELLEIVVKILVIQKHPVVIEVAVETVLHRADRLGDLPDIGVAGESDKRRVHTFA